MGIFRGCIAIVNFGDKQGSVQNGIRPAVIIQNDIGNKYSTTTIVVPITGKMKKELPTHHKLLKKDYNCLLKCDSTILGEQVLTISKSQIMRNIGVLKEEDLNKLDKALAISINLNTKIY